jgi:hypothetical protein
VQEICISKGSFVNHKTSQHGAFAHLPWLPLAYKSNPEIILFSKYALPVGFSVKHHHHFNDN